MTVTKSRDITNVQVKKLSRTYLELHNSVLEVDVGVDSRVRSLFGELELQVVVYTVSVFYLLLQPRYLLTNGMG